jgi:hypothetical protein
MEGLYRKAFAESNKGGFTPGSVAVQDGAVAQAQTDSVTEQRRQTEEAYARGELSDEDYDAAMDEFDRAEEERIGRSAEKYSFGGTQKNTAESGVRYSLKDISVPNREDLEKKPPMKVIDISAPKNKGTFSQRRKLILMDAEKIISKPYLNKDTKTLIFLTEKSYTHAFNNAGDIQLNAVEHLPELIENAVLTHAESPDHGSEYTDGVYTFFAAVRDGKIMPVKLKVKEYTYAGQDLPKNIKAYFENSPQGYAASYDTVVLEVEEIEKSPSGSAKDMNQGDSFLSPERLSKITIADLLKLVNDKYQKYIPQSSHRNTVNSQFSFSGSSIYDGSDVSYIDAVKRGDMKTAQRIVDDAAKAAGYTIKAYHGTSNNFWTFQKGHKRTRGSLNFGSGFYFSPDRTLAENYTNTGRVIDGYLKLDNPYIVYGTRFDQSDLNRISLELGKEVTIDNVTQALQNAGYDGIIAKTYNGTTNPVNQYVVFDANQIKSADSVTYDGDGNVIPLSERFNEKKSDIRYSFSSPKVKEQGRPLEGWYDSDEKQLQAKKAGYPVLKGEQVVPYATWVRSEERGNYGLVTGKTDDGRLLVSFHNKHDGSMVWDRKNRSPELGKIEPHRVSGAVHICFWNTKYGATA